MATTVAATAQATPGERLARVCPKPAAASLPADDWKQEHPDAFECIEATQRQFKKSDKEMAALLQISQGNYSRRRYNAARVELLDLEMRQYCAQQQAEHLGLHAALITPEQRLKAATSDAIVCLLTLMKAL